MSTIVLYLGGMAGDFFVSCLNPNQLESIYIAVTVKKEFVLLKKFWQMTDDEKLTYINNHNSTAFLSSHDTNFSLQHPDRTIRILCSNIDTLTKLSSRFGALHRPEILEHLCSQLNINQDNFDAEYAQMCANWNQSFTFPRQFDISNIFNTKQFLLDFEEFCIMHSIPFDIKQVELLHKTWKEQNENFNR